MSKFSTYDHFGYLIVGSIAILVIYIDFGILGTDFPNVNLTTLPVWIIVSYFTGHIIQSISNLIIHEKKNQFTKEEKELLSMGSSYFNLENMSNEEVWSLCYMYTISRDTTGQINLFNAYYSLYRGWVIIFMIETVFLLFLTIFLFSTLSVILLIISILLTSLFYRRSKRFFRYLRTKVLHLFVLLRAIDNNNANINRCSG